MSFTVEFRRAGLSAEWSDGSSLLEFAESQGLHPDYNCCAGVCGTCMTALLAGDVTYDEQPAIDLPPGFALLCCGRPAGPITLDL